jgi:hypothetical protein
LCFVTRRSIRRLLAKGFHIVTGPVGVSFVVKDWRYKKLGGKIQVIVKKGEVIRSHPRIRPRLWTLSPGQLCRGIQGFSSFIAACLSQRDTAYEYLTGHGFSKKPAMEGAGGGAGEVYAWAIENPGKVSCVYAENPRFRPPVSRSGSSFRPERLERFAEAAFQPQAYCP